jgi:hypothetical protein
MSHPARGDRSIDRRTFVKASLIPALLPLSSAGLLETACGDEPAPKAEPAPEPPEIIDTNIHLFDWPFRKLKYADTDKLVAKLRRHRITRAWANMKITPCASLICALANPGKNGGAWA